MKWVEIYVFILSYITVDIVLIKSTSIKQMIGRIDSVSLNNEFKNI